jgi:hypothetical protein
MNRAAPAPRFNDDRQLLLERLAHGKCSAVSRRVGATLSWLPTVAGEIIDKSGFPDGHRTNFEAVRAARRFRDQCLQELAETNGSV